MLQKFLQLTVKDVESIARNEQFYNMYLDWLMLLQDLVSPLAPARSHRFFDKDNLQARLRESASEIPHGYETVREKVEANTQTAMALVNQKVYSIEAANEIATSAEEFLDEIAHSYSVLRNFRKVLRV